MILIAAMYMNSQNKDLQLEASLKKISRSIHVNYFGNEEKFIDQHYFKMVKYKDGYEEKERVEYLTAYNDPMYNYKNSKGAKICKHSLENTASDSVSWIDLPSTQIEFEFYDKKIKNEESDSSSAQDLRNLYLNNRKVKYGGKSKGETLPDDFPNGIENVAFSKHIVGVFHLRYRNDKKKGTGWYWVPVAFGDMSSLAVQALPGRKNFYKVSMKILDFTAMLNLKTFEENIDMKKYHEIIDTPYKEEKSKKDIAQKEANKTERKEGRN